MLRQAFASAPTDSALISLCCAPQTSGQPSLPEFVLRAEKALEVHSLFATDTQCHLHVLSLQRDRSNRACALRRGKWTQQTGSYKTAWPAACKSVACMF